MATIKFSGSYKQMTIRRAEYKFEVDEETFLKWLDEEQGEEYNNIASIAADELEHWLGEYAYSEVLPVEEEVEGDGDPDWRDVVVA
jgi:hypothetical protein